MPAVNCPVTGCDYVTQDLSEALTLKCLDLHAAADHAGPTPTKSNNKCKKPDRPEVSLDITESQYAFFKEEWRIYKTRCGLQPEEITLELRAACTTELRRSLFDFIGIDALNSATEDNLLDHIEKVAVKAKNTAVHRQEFYSMSQAPDETILSFVSRLRSKASHCCFATECTCKAAVSYAVEMITDQMIVGLSDSDCQAEILAKGDTLKTFDNKYDYIVATEKGRLAQTSLTSSSNHQIKSSYRRGITSHPHQPPDKPKPPGCSGCGDTSHGRGTKRPRNKHCPHWDKTCGKCGKLGHKESVCRGPKPMPDDKAPPSPKPPTALSSFGYDDHEDISKLFQVSSVSLSPQHNPESDVLVINSDVHTLPHMEWKNGSFRPCPPKKPRLLPLHAEVLPEAHAKAGHAISSNIPHLKSGMTLCTADTGAQTCVSDPAILNSLGVSAESLMPTTHKIRSANHPISIMGALFVKFTFQDRSTCQMVYVCNDVTGIYLSEKAQIDLGIISESYPFVKCQQPSSIASNTPVNAACGCPARSKCPPRPNELPFPATVDNREKLQKWIIDYYSSSAFNTCPHQELPIMSGRPLKIHLKPDATPKAYHTPIPVPFHWKKQVKEDLDMDVKLGTIEPVPQGTPTKWCSRMVCVGKKDSVMKDGEVIKGVRRTVDLQPVNAASYRETHHCPSPFNQASAIPRNSKKTVVDAWNGYHSLPLDDESKDLTCFITEWGRYRYRRAPQGFHAAGDAYNRHFDDITKDFPRQTRQTDDTLLWDTADGDQPLTDAFWHIVDYIELCHNNGIIFKPSKFQFAQDDVEYSGLIISNSGVRPSDDLSEAILNFPVPQNLTDIRSWFGIVNQAAYTFATTSEMAPFRELLKKNSQWYWDDKLTELFEQTKLRIVENIQHGVKLFQLGKPLRLFTDWSKMGLGYMLQQKMCNCPGASHECCPDWQIIYAGSRFTSDAETRYAPIEGEALAVAHGLKKCRMFVLGCPELHVVVDHEPLVRLLSDRELADIPNPRLFRIKEKTLPYRYKIHYSPGIDNPADPLSRHPHDPAPPDESDDLDSSCVSVVASTLLDIDARDHPSSVTWARVQQETSTDPVLSELADVISSGFPAHKQSLPPKLQPYWDVRHDLSRVGNAIAYGPRAVIPQSLRTEVLDGLHSAHQGVSAMKARARRCVYWPGLSAAIVNRRNNCRRCDTIAPSQSPEPLCVTPDPDYPFQQVATDFCQVGSSKFLIYVDRYTGWVSISSISNTQQANAAFVEAEFRKWFAIYGVPEHMTYDGGPPFGSASLDRFLNHWGVDTTWTSSAHFAQSNGRAELAVKAAKRMIYDNVSPDGSLNTDRFVRALLQHRNTPLQGIDRSPAELLYGRPIRDHLPTPNMMADISQGWQSLLLDREIALAKRHVRNKESFDYRKRTHVLPALSPGDYVVIQNQSGNYPRRWDKTGVVKEVRPDRQYIIKTHGSGRLVLRNRAHLRKIQPMLSDTPLPKPNPAYVNDPPPTLDPSPYVTVPPSQPQMPLPPGCLVPAPKPSSPITASVRHSGYPKQPAASPEPPRASPVPSTPVPAPMPRPVTPAPMPQPVTPAPMPQPATPAPIHPQPGPSPPALRRSTRQVKLPDHLKDYELG